MCLSIFTQSRNKTVAMACYIGHVTCFSKDYTASPQLLKTLNVPKPSLSLSLGSDDI